MPASPPASPAIAPLVRRGDQTLAEQLADRFAHRIRDRLLPAGARLPSVRQCAAQHGLSPSTVVAAYDRLLARGLIEARRHRGFFVRDHPVEARTVPAAPVPHAPDAPPRAPVDAATLIRSMFHQPSERPQPGMGVLPPDWLDAGLLASAVRRVAGGRRLLEASLRYGDPKGDPELRHVLSHGLRGLGVEVQPAQILTAVGATQALDIVSRTLLRPGDAVMVEDPGWSVEFARLQAMGMRMLPVPRGPHGPDLDAMARYAQTHAPKLFVSVSVLHNPTGHSLSPGHAHRVLELAHRHGFYVVEDDTYGHFAPEHAIRLSVLDGLRRTFYVGGFAKVLAPDWRIGYVAAPRDWVERLVDVKLLSTLTTPGVLERALAHCIAQGWLRRHVQRLQVRLAPARQRSVRLAQEAGCRFVAEPAGVFGWVDTGVDTERLAQSLLDAGYLIAPGRLFHAERRPSTCMRINFATTQAPAFWRAFVQARRRLGG